MHLWYRIPTHREYQVDRITEPPEARSERVLFGIDWPQFNHNGGWLASCRRLSLHSTGDGGYANDWGIRHNVTPRQRSGSRHPPGKILPSTSIRANFTHPGGQPVRRRSEREPRSGLWCATRGAAPSSRARQRALPVAMSARTPSSGQADRLRRESRWRVMVGNHASTTTTDRPSAECDSAGITPPIIESPNCNVFSDCRASRSPALCLSRREQGLGRRLHSSVLECPLRRDGRPPLRRRAGEDGAGPWSG